MNNKTSVIAIDGPAASGKSTVARMKAKRLNIPYINTGNMYRAITYFFIKNDIDFENINFSDLKTLLNSISLKYVETHDDGFALSLNEKILGSEIRSPEVAQQVSRVAKNPVVREVMTSLQREYGQQHLVVMEGRDIGSVVFPNAKYKFFVMASPLIRAQRRLNQSGETFSDATLESVVAEITARDKIDMEREIAPLKQADDAILVDTSELTIDQVVEKIISYI